MRKLLILLLAFVFGCTQEPESFEIIGYRGWRGMYPENSMTGFVQAAGIGLTHFHLDVVISADGFAVVSADPWLSSAMCSDPNGNPLYASTERAYNLYQMRYREIVRAQCGMRQHPDFPNQKKVSTFKPLLSEVLDTLEKLQPFPEAFRYTIEIRSSTQGDNLFHPVPQTYVETVLGIVKLNSVEKRTIIRSSDSRVLVYLHEFFPEIKLALVVDTTMSIEEKWVDLGFSPDIISPHVDMVFKELVDQMHNEGIRVIPWMVDDIHVAEQLRQYGVDGFLTDYPDQYHHPL
ncbi:MAG: hypothetical protein JJU02_15165 [Cryomorphaceae bacterium]|nr:hypothetical protein [Cryomorphaceae bacterium]